MKTTVTETQTAFFTKNGFIEFEVPHQIPPSSSERDQWREDEALKSFILKVLGPLSLTLTGKKKLRLGTCFWITKENRPQTQGKLKEFLSLQNLAIAISMAPFPIIPNKRSPLGILPLPSSANHILFFRPDLILDWPSVSTDLFLTLFTLSNGIYIHNPKDPKTTYLQKLGYEYGDTLENETHPLIFV